MALDFADDAEDFDDDFVVRDVVVLDLHVDLVLVLLLSVSTVSCGLAVEVFAISVENQVAPEKREERQQGTCENKLCNVL